MVVIDCDKSGVSVLLCSVLVSGCKDNATEKGGGRVPLFMQPVLAGGCRNEGAEEVDGGGGRLGAWISG